MNLFNYKRRTSVVVSIGNTPLGGDYPIRIQSMTNTSTLDTGASTEQCIRIIDAGSDYVRLTAQGVREAENLSHIHAALRQRGYQAPLIADIHFNPKAAETAAKYVEKVRINPGNFVDPVKTFKTFEYTDGEYAAEIEKIRTRLLPFLEICREHHTAVRLGVNHGSLSDRIMSRYGDTPAGMVESCMEFLRIFVAEKFFNVVISIKSSNTVVMVKTVHLLVDRMESEGMSFPLHLGVTEAGDGEDGRIKSALGIGALLSAGIGDTIRVSLSEDPEEEIPVARKLVDYIISKENHLFIDAQADPAFDPASMERRKTRSLKNMGGDAIPVVVAEWAGSQSHALQPFSADYWYLKDGNIPVSDQEKNFILDFAKWKKQTNSYPLFQVSEIYAMQACNSPLKFLRLTYQDRSPEIAALLTKDTSLAVILDTFHPNGSAEQQAFFHWLQINRCDIPVIVHRQYNEDLTEDLQIKAAADFGSVLLNGFGEGIMLSNIGKIMPGSLLSCMYGILQAARLRISKTEYISCPSCGRTLFDLKNTIKRVKEATSHLKGLKIGIMGCIVNGPGEMADADYGYVGSGKGKVDLYKGKEKLEKNIPEEEAVDKLIQLIQKYGDWQPERMPD